MELDQFDGANTTFAKDQPQYRALPAYRSGDDYGTIACCWRLTLRERLRVLLTGRVWHEVLTFGKPLQPQKLGLDRPDYIPRAMRDGDEGA